MWYIIIAVAALTIGYILSGLMSNNTNIKKMEQAYNQGFKEGFKEGKESVLKDVSNLYDKYKELSERTE